MRDVSFVGKDIPDELDHEGLEGYSKGPLREYFRDFRHPVLLCG